MRTLKTLTPIGFATAASASMVTALNLFESGFAASGNKGLIMCSIAGLGLVGFVTNTIAFLWSVSGRKCK